jgi:hypothetical protein
MPTKGKNLTDLSNFLGGSFTKSELQRFLTEYGHEEVLHEVYSDCADAHYFFEVVLALNRRGEINANFFDYLKKERQQKTTGIQALELVWRETGGKRSAELQATPPKVYRMSQLVGRWTGPINNETWLIDLQKGEQKRPWPWKSPSHMPVIPVPEEFGGLWWTDKTNWLCVVQTNYAPLTKLFRHEKGAIPWIDDILVRVTRKMFVLRDGTTFTRVESSPHNR